MLFNLILILFVTLAGARALTSLIAIIIGLQWYRRCSKSEIELMDEPLNILVMIPVLREQFVIEETLNYFMKLRRSDNMKILVVTTERENKESVFFPKSTTSTQQVVDHFIKKFHNGEPKRIFSLHYPDPTGRMADQLNYAFDRLHEYGISDYDFVAIYNADSRPSVDTIEMLERRIKHTSGRAFQQSAVYFHNYEHIGNSRPLIIGKLLQTNAILQTRWTLAHELPRLWRQSESLRKWKKRLFLTHCVGHGLFLRVDLLREIGGFPTKTLTEDLFLGYILSVQGEPVYPLPVLENTESPHTLRATFKQKYVWFFGPMDHISYYMYSVRQPSLSCGKAVAAWHAFQGLIPAITWSTKGLCVILIFIITLQKMGTLSVIAGIVLLTYALSFAWTAEGVCAYLRESGETIHLGPGHLFIISILSFPVAILHSLPPWASIAAKVRLHMFGVTPPKPKTE